MVYSCVLCFSGALLCSLSFPGSLLFLWSLVLSGVFCRLLVLPFALCRSLGLSVVLYCCLVFAGALWWFRFLCLLLFSFVLWCFIFWFNVFSKFSIWDNTVDGLIRKGILSENAFETTLMFSTVSIRTRLYTRAILEKNA